MKKAVKKAAPKKAAPDWRRDTLARVRALIEEADPEATEEAKWKKANNHAGVPTWSHDGIICTGETYKDNVKLTFASGASLPDPARLFNAADTGASWLPSIPRWSNTRPYSPAAASTRSPSACTAAARWSTRASSDWSKPA